MSFLLRRYNNRVFRQLSDNVAGARRLVILPALLRRFAMSNGHPTKLHNVVFVLGLPGSGKGTQCAMINEEFGFVHLSAGELLRDEAKRAAESKLGQLIKDHMTNGTIVPVEITCKLLENAMHAIGDVPGFLIDGFPRNQDNLDGWQREMNDKTHVHFVLNLVAPDEICVQRCLSRSSGRIDDNADTLRKRFETHNKTTAPIIEHYRKLGLLREIDSQASPEEVMEEVRKVFLEAGFKPVTQASS